MLTRPTGNQAATHRLRPTVVIVAAIAVLAATACGGGGDDSPADLASISIVNYNVLHGLPLGNCPEETEFCKAAVRLDMMWELIETEANCPDVVALQEIAPLQAELIPPRLDEVCDGKYEIVSESSGFPVEQWILSSLPVLDAATEQISGAVRSIQWVSLDSDLGPIDLYATHFVASIDDFPCDEGICAPGLEAGVCDLGMTTGECNPLEALDFIDRTADPSTITILAGDLNASIDDERIVTITDAGFVDVWELAGLAECDPDTGLHCTSGQLGEGPYDGLDIVDNTRDSRIDFVLVRAPDDCELAVAEGATGIFAGEPFDPPVDGIFWPSDHAGVRTAVGCR
jgi:hypothetical protein